MKSNEGIYMQTRVLSEPALDNSIIQNAYSILMGNIYLLGKENEHRTIAITSCNPKEGKTSLSTALAITLAGMGKKTLLVNLDLRKKGVLGQTEQTDILGIAEYIKGEAGLDEAVCSTNIENLEFLDSGGVIGDPIYYLCSDKFNYFVRFVRNEYDYVIFDTPSLECITDAVIVSSKVDATILVAKMKHTTILNIKKAQEQLNKVNANLIGVVLNNVQKRMYKKKFSSFNYFTKDSTKPGLFRGRIHLRRKGAGK